MLIGISPKDNTWATAIEGWRDDVTGFFRELSPNKDYFDKIQWVADIALSCIPIVGDARDIVELITGVDMVTGEKLSIWQRLTTAVCMLVPFVGAKFGREIVDGIGKLFKNWD